MNKTIKCEKCKEIIGEYEQISPKLVNVKLYDNGIVCPKCKCEMCKTCYSKMTKCFACGKPIDREVKK